MSFLVKTPALPQGAAGADPKHNSGYKAADVVPVGWGRDVFPSKWITDKYLVHTVRDKDGTERQYASIAAAYCAGPIDFIGFVFVDGKRVGDGLDFNYSAHGYPESQSFTLTNGWRMVVHRGSETAPAADADALSAGTGQTHSPYRGIVWIEWRDIELSGGSLPSIAIELGRHVPVIGDFSTGDQHPQGVNPFAAVYALCTAANGGDFDDGLLDPAHWGQQALDLESVGVAGRTYSQVYCHPTFTASTTLGDALSQILAYVDGYLYASDGRLRVGWFPGGTDLPTGLPEITEADLEAKPSGGGIPDWNEGPTSVVVIFRSFAKDYEEDVARYNAPGNRENNVSAEPARKERPFIHDAGQAAMIAAASATDSSTGEIATNLTVLKSRVATLHPGDLVNWDYAPHALDLLCRVTARRIRMGAASDVLTLTRERGAYPRPYVAPVDERVLPADDLPGEIDPADVRLWLLPPGLTGLRCVAPLVNRSKRTIYRADLHLSPTGSSPWEDILDSRGFAARVAVAGSGINLADTSLRITSASVDMPRMGTQSAVAQGDDTLLLLLGDELLSVAAVTAVMPAGTYDLTVLRGRRRTTATAHASAAVGWLFYRRELAFVEHAEFYRVRDGTNTYHAPTATKHFKLQLFTLGAEGDPKPDGTGLALQLPDLAADESLGYTISLDNDAHTVACASDGTVNSGQLGIGSSAAARVRVLRGGLPLTAVASAPNSDQFSLAINPTDSLGTTAAKDGHDRVYCSALTLDTGIVAIDVTFAGAFTLQKRLTLTKARAGTNGTNGASGTSGGFTDYVFKRAATIPATPTGASPFGWADAPPAADGNPLWMSSAEKTATGFVIGSWSLPVQIEGDSIIVEYSVNGTSGWHASFTTGDLYMRVKTGVAGTFSAAIRIVGEAGAAGLRGSKQFYAVTAGTSWNDTEASNAIAAAGFTRLTLDTVTLYKTTAPQYSETRYWSGSAWTPVAQVIDGNLIVHGTVGTDHLVAGISLTTPLILGGTLQLNGASTVCSNTTNGADNSIVRLNGGGGPNVTSGYRGGQVDVLGNEYTTVPGYSGSVLLTPGAVPTGTVRLRDHNGVERLIAHSTGVTLAGAISVTGTVTASAGLSVTGSSNIYGGGLGVAHQVIAGTYAQAPVFRGAGGTAGSPCFAIDGDLDTGMYSDEADKLKFAAGGTEVMRLLNISGSPYLKLAGGATLQLGHTRLPITTETPAYYITALDASGNTLKLAVVD